MNSEMGTEGGRGSAISALSGKKGKFFGRRKCGGPQNYLILYNVAAEEVILYVYLKRTSSYFHE
jgi:hypothetical protein